MQKPWSPSSKKETELMYENFRDKGKSVKAIKKVAKQTWPNNEKKTLKKLRKESFLRESTLGIWNRLMKN